MILTHHGIDSLRKFLNLSYLNDFYEESSLWYDRGVYQTIKPNGSIIIPKLINELTPIGSIVVPTFYNILCSFYSFYEIPCRYITIDFFCRFGSLNGSADFGSPSFGEFSLNPSNPGLALSFGSQDDNIEIKNHSIFLGGVRSVGFRKFYNLNISVNNWHHLASVVDILSGKCKIYIDGVLSLIVNSSHRFFVNGKDYLAHSMWSDYAYDIAVTQMSVRRGVCFSGDSFIVPTKPYVLV